ncbi:hypothetical protein NMY22_g4975 [Coprinellus aureogranulatus]|nr:hypothetical protein NMY22_g4975 [Coprinellus aureogranulatus]
MSPPDTPDRPTTAVLDSSESTEIAFDLNDMEVHPEIWVEVAMNLEPNAILSLASASKALHAALHQKGLWIQSLQSVSRAYGIFLPTFPFECMSLSEIKAAALRPGRWNTYLVPGGRFLVTCGFTYNGVSLWDLGCPGSGNSSQLRKVASYSWEDEGWTSTGPRCVICSSSQESLKILVFSWTESRRRVRAKVLSISPAAKDATFSVSGSLRIDACNRSVGDPCIRELHVLFFFQNTLILWKYEDGEVIRWTLPVRDYVGTTACLPHSSLVVCITKRGYAGWKLPPFGERVILNGSLDVPDFSLSPFPVPPDFTAEFPWGPKARFSELSFFANPCPTSTSPVRLNIRHNFHLYRYHVVAPLSVRGDVESFDVEAVTIAGWLDRMFDPRASDCFGGGFCFDWGGKVGSTYIYEGIPHTHGKVEIGRRLTLCRTVKVRNPNGNHTVKPLAGCTLSGRVLYRVDQDTLACVDYLP